MKRYNTSKINKQRPLHVISETNPDDSAQPSTEPGPASRATDWDTIRPTLNNPNPSHPLTHETLQIADDEFRRFGDIAINDQIHVIPYERFGLDHTGVKWVEDAINLEYLMIEYPRAGQEMLACVISSVTKYLDSTNSHQRTHFLNDLTNLSQYAYANDELWLVGIEPHLAETKHETLRQTTKRLLGQSTLLLSSYSPRAILATDAITSWRNKIGA